MNAPKLYFQKPLVRECKRHVKAPDWMEVWRGK